MKSAEEEGFISSEKVYEELNINEDKQDDSQKRINCHALMFRNNTTFK